jgi:N-acetylated-alpha-linked acidic dipeptidase
MEEFDMRMVWLRALVCVLVSSVAVSAATGGGLSGFDDASAQRALEGRFDSFLVPNNVRTTMERLAARPHPIGSASTKANADFIAEQFRAAGFDARIEQFDVLFPTPTKRRLELVGPARYVAKLDEPPLPEDKSSAQRAEQLPTYNAYSIDGDVTAELVYVNYGVPADYERLAENGVDVRGKIVIARYGGSWRGIKPKVAAERGAVGCIIYSDPRDDGYFQGDVYPGGAYRNEWGTQRGSVADMPLYPGDPLTPGVGATKDAKRIDRRDCPTLTKIPVLPISYGDAEPLLRALGGPVAPPEWRGALPLTYHLGAGPAKVHLELAFAWNTVPCYDVVGVLRGSELPDEWVIRGNHYDAWVNGADDPVSGAAAMLEEARALGELVKTGWRPKRTLVYCLWDGEEPGLLGSTEWVEAHADELRQKAVAYVNSDSNGRGFLYVGGSHTLEGFMNEVARDVVDPQKQITVLERARALAIRNGSPPERDEARTRSDIRIDALGSGSDFTPFLQHLGVASLNIGFGGEDGGGSYHSIYDSIEHYERFGDPTFQYGVTLAKTIGRVVLRLADADVLPFRPSALAETVGRYVREVKALEDSTRAATDERNRMIADGTYAAVADPTRPFVVPPVQDVVPHLNFAPLENALDRVQTSAAAFDRAARERRGLSTEQRAALDRLLMGLERALTRPEGLPGRPWFVHQVYAPGFYTGYGVKTLPGVREAIEQRKWKEAEAQIVVLAGVLDGYADQVERATALMKAGQ